MSRPARREAIISHVEHHKDQRATLPLALLVLLCSACGSRKSEDIETRREQEAAERIKNEQPLVIAGENASLDAAAATGSCAVELARSSVFQPGADSGDSQVVILFQGRLEERCITEAPEVHFYSEGALTLPSATCQPQDGDFNLKCTGGNIVKHAGGGKIELRLDGSKPQAQLETLRVKVVYAE
jgi:hypothetical protein